jgi:phosphate-selective porin O/P
MHSFARITVAAATASLLSAAALAQVSQPAGNTRPDDTPSVKLGSTIFADYTFNESPTATDADGNTIRNSSFNVTRAYINVLGNLNHFISYRITPDITRETGSGSSLAGSYTFRLKYAFGQFNLDDWTTRGSWVRLGLQQTPIVDYEESIYRYRFQGPVFADREGFLTASDNGLSGHWNFPGNHGEVHAGFYNGEGYSKAETNNEKAFQIRGTVRPLPLAGIWKGLRVTGFLDEDHYVRSAKRTRVVAQLTFEHPLLNAGVDYLTAKDQTGATKTEVEANGYSVWVTPRLGKSGWEMLLRHDQLKPNKSVSQKRTRNIAGIAYWFPNLSKAQSALMVDYDSLKQSNYSPSRLNDTRYGLKMLVNF